MYHEALLAGRQADSDNGYLREDEIQKTIYRVNKQQDFNQQQLAAIQGRFKSLIISNLGILILLSL